ncbi:MAG TPA: flagellin [Alphaproteobacteria bacterium]|nr:flagellin [Alphaproteobacteria bacterium]
MADIQLTSASRNSLLLLTQTQSLTERTQGRLSTGLRVSSVIDDAVAFFQGKALNDRASDFGDRKQEIDQGVSSLKAAINGTSTIDSLLKQMKGVANNARAATTEERKEATKTFKELAKQIFQVVEDSSYQGLNLLTKTSSKLSVRFSERSAATLDVSGVDLNSTAAGKSIFQGRTTVSAFSSSGSFAFSAVFTVAGSFTAIAASMNQAAIFDKAVANLDKSISKLRGISQSLGTNVAVLQTRLDFTKNYTNTLQEGSGKLTLADLNEEGANLVALQTRQQLGIQTLSSAGQAQQSILQLLR